jgi:hypothetical protein
MQLGNPIQRWVDAAGQLNSMLGANENGRTALERIQ